MSNQPQILLANCLQRRVSQPQQEVLCFMLQNYFTNSSVHLGLPMLIFAEKVVFLLAIVLHFFSALLFSKDGMIYLFTVVCMLVYTYIWFIIFRDLVELLLFPSRLTIMYNVKVTIRVGLFICFIFLYFIGCVVRSPPTKTFRPKLIRNHL